MSAYSHRELPDAEKYAHQQVHFEHPAKGKNHCGECRHFMAAVSRCEIVRSPIRATDWCEHFEKEDQ